MHIKARPREQANEKFNESPAVLCNENTGCGLPASGYQAGDKVKAQEKGSAGKWEGLSLARVNNISFILQA